MHKWLLTVAVAFLAVSVSFGQASPKAVIEKALKATGGKELLEKYPAGKTTISGEMTQMGMTIELEGTITAAPGKSRTELNLTVAGNKVEVLQVATDKIAKIRLKVMGMVVNQPLEEPQEEEMKLSTIISEMTQLLPLLDEKKYTLKSEADEEVEKKKCDVVTVTMIAQKKTVKLYFDKETNLLTKSGHEGLLPGRQDGKKGNRETIYSDYKKVDGIQHPMKMVSLADGEVYLTAKITDHKNLEKVDDKVFTIED
jgi:hypothetical protein